MYFYCFHWHHPEGEEENKHTYQQYVHPHLFDIELPAADVAEHSIVGYEAPQFGKVDHPLYCIGKYYLQ